MDLTMEFYNNIDINVIQITLTLMLVDMLFNGF